MNKILDNNYYDLIISNALVPSHDSEDTITFLNKSHSLLHIPVVAEEPCNLGKQPYNRFPTIYSLTSTISLERSGVSIVQQNPFLSLYGQGVLVAIIDTGIEYQHPAFLYNDGSSRILSIWDQTVQNGTPPDNFTFGSEYTREQINEALNFEDPFAIVPTIDENGHGTAIASIIAGTPNKDQSFRGVVPESDLIIVKLKEAKENLKKLFFIPAPALCYQESDIILGIRYAATISENLGRPLVICIAMGSSQGGHQGLGAISSYLYTLGLLPGNGVSVSAGNEGNMRRHYHKSITSPPYYNTVELRVGNADKMFLLEIWSFSTARLSVDIFSPTKESTRSIFPSIDECRKFNFIFSQTTIWVNNIIIEEETGAQLILIRFENALSGIWSIRLEDLEKEPYVIESWLPSGNLISDETFFLDSSPDTTITSPGNARNVLTVSAYNQLTENILLQSSRGYTVTGRIKPDLAAPGYQLPCAVPGNRYGTATGTGAAAAHAAGIQAMIFEWAAIRENYPRITGNNVNRLLISAAVRSPESTYPNNIWGYGQINVNNIFERFTI